MLPPEPLRPPPPPPARNPSRKQGASNQSSEFSTTTPRIKHVRHAETVEEEPEVVSDVESEDSYTTSSIRVRRRASFCDKEAASCEHHDSLSFVIKAGAADLDRKNGYAKHVKFGFTKHGRRYPIGYSYSSQCKHENFNARPRSVLRLLQLSRG